MWNVHFLFICFEIKGYFKGTLFNTSVLYYVTEIVQTYFTWNDKLTSIYL